ncbi:MAG TPA: hypothetical protein PKK78_22620 [Kouleothrix sp.]|nr:hypothetical protein [Kouleothrix sp.]
MSFITSAEHGTFVSCDVCGNYSALFDPDWRRVRNTTDGQPQHLCRECRKSAVWCETHRCYHRAADNHRCPCVVCGGLFTAQVQRNIQHCPACRPVSAPLTRPGGTRKSLWSAIQHHLLTLLM